jgi:hypothetical protein
LVFVPRNEIISSEQEKNRYDQHQNNKDDKYFTYLNGIVSSILPYIKKDSRGLDFGCGSTTLFSDILREHGFQSDSYDIYYHPKQEVWNRKYDFITLSEVIEHLHDPYDTIKRLTCLLNSNGIIFIKTKFLNEDIDFSNWYYKRDLTHIQFFNQKSMGILAHQFGFKVIKVGLDLYLWNQ